MRFVTGTRIGERDASYAELHRSDDALLVAIGITALAVAAEPTLGQLGFTIMAIAALLWPSVRALDAACASIRDGGGGAVRNRRHRSAARTNAAVGMPSTASRMR